MDLVGLRTLEMAVTLAIFGILTPFSGKHRDLQKPSVRAFAFAKRKRKHTHTHTKHTKHTQAESHPFHASRRLVKVTKAAARLWSSDRTASFRSLKEPMRVSGTRTPPYNGYT